MTWKKALIGGTAAVVLAVAAGIAGWWFLIREDAHLATDPPSIPQSLLTTATGTPGAGSTTAANNTASAAPTTSAAGTLTFQVNSSNSEADYFVNEELASVGIPSTAKGTTRNVSGTLYLTADGAALAPAATSQFSVGLTSLTSDKSMRDSRVQQALETGRYPTSPFTITSVSGYDPSLPEAQQQSLQMTGILDLHGVKKQVTWDVKAYRQSNVISALATVTVSFADFNITAPTFGGLVSIDDKATLQVQLIAQQA